MFTLVMVVTLVVLFTVVVIIISIVAIIGPDFFFSWFLIFRFLIFMFLIFLLILFFACNLDVTKTAIISAVARNCKYYKRVINGSGDKN